MSHLPVISIVTTCYNHSRWIGETLESIHSQNYPRLEHIVVDGASTDGSVEIIRRYADRLAWWCSEPDRGHGDALAKGFAHVTGGVVTWVCSDDILLPGALEAVGEHFARHPQCRWISGNGITIGEDGKVLFNVYAVPLSHGSLTYWGCWGAVQPSVLIRYEALREAGGIDPSRDLNPDYDLFLRLARGGPSQTLGRFIGGLRMHRQTQTVCLNEQLAAGARALREREGYAKAGPLGAQLCRWYYQTKFINWQRLNKVLHWTARPGLKGGYPIGRHWSLARDAT